MPQTDHRLYLIDISSFIFRAFYAIRMLTSPNGEPVNAVYGVAQMVTAVIDEAGATQVAAVYDSKEPSFRKEMYTEYKANRSAPPDELIPQFDRIEELIKAMGLCSYRQAGVEADDLIASLTRMWIALDPKNEVIIVSGDKDLMALVGDRVRVWDTLTKKTYRAPEVVEKFGVNPDQIRDYLALVGDSSDNIPGVPSIGPKSATDLLKQFGTLEGVLDAATAGKIAGKKGETIQANRADALLSQKLATLKEDIPLKLDHKCVSYVPQVSPDLEDLFKELGFKNLLEKWKAERKPGVAVAAAQAPAAGPVGQQTSMHVEIPSQPTGDFKAVQTESDFSKVLEGIDRRREFGFDLETTSLNPRAAELVGVAIALDEAGGYYIPVGHRVGDQLPQAQVMAKLKPILEDARYKKIGQNLKYDFEVLMEMGLKPTGIGADTMVASYVLAPEGRHNLATLAQTYLGYKVLSYEEVCGKGKDQVGFDQIPIDLATRYSAEDAWIALKLWRDLLPKLNSEGVMPVFAEIDLPLVEVLARMEIQGVCLNEKWLAGLSKEFESDLARIQAAVEKYSRGPINLNSPKQLAQLLFEDLKLPHGGKTKTGYSTDASVLEGLADLHEVPRMLLEFREIAKLKGTYVDPLPLLKDPKTGKIHAGFHQTVAATGRLSSSDPNLQNIPIRTERGRRIRGAFIPCPGNVFIAADYSQIELRLLAHMSGDKELMASFNRDEDVHRRTASEIFGVPPESVDDRSRGIAKAINFGLMYGKTPFGLAQELGIPQREARAIIDRYFERYSGVKSFLDGQVKMAHERGYVTTESGRKRRLPDLHAKNKMVRENAERMAMNTPIQGTAADLIKIAMIRLDEELTRRRLEAKMIIQVHDELVLDVPKAEAAQVTELLKEVMESAMTLKVPLKVNAAQGESWLEV